MYFGKFLRTTFLRTNIFNPVKVYHRNVQISIVGAGSDVGSKVAVMLKQNPLIETLHLYDDDPNIDGLALEISLIPEGPYVTTFIGETDLPEAIERSDLIVTMPKTQDVDSITMEELLAKNVPDLLKLCKVIAEFNPTAFIAIAEEPINSIVPCASAALDRLGVLNPAKLFGITQMDNTRTRAITASYLKLKPSAVDLPVIGGHSPFTVVPLFSNLSVSDMKLESNQIDWLTRLVRKNGPDFNLRKQQEQDILSNAFAIHEFILGMINAIRGGRVTLNTFVANNNFNTKFFAGPTILSGNKNVFKVCTPYNVSKYEENLLESSKEYILRDILAGENFLSSRE